MHCAHDGAYNRQRANAIEQCAGGYALGQFVVAAFFHGSFQPFVQSEHAAHKRSHCKAYDKKHGIFAVVHAGGTGIEAEHQAGQSQSIEKPCAVFGFYSALYY